MPAYQYRAVHDAGHIVSGVVAAANESELAQYLGGSRLELIEAREKKEQTHSLRLAQRASPRALTLFCASMRDVLEAGVPFVDALHDIAADMEQGALRHEVAEIERDIRHGSAIAKAFALHARQFPPVFIAILSAGEASGDLVGTFSRLADYTEARARMNERLRRALRYPLFLLAVALGVFVFMMSYVVPQIIVFLNTIDGQLPPMTRILIAVSDVFSKSWWIAGLLFLALALAAGIARRVSEDAARLIDAAMLRLPMMGSVLRKLTLARFAHSFSILFQSGIGIPECLAGASATLGNRALIAKLDAVSERVRAGSALSSAMSEMFPPFALRIMSIGEQSGQLGKSLADIAATYDREAADATDRMLGALEPALTMMVGALLAWIVLAVLGPIYGNLSKMNVVG